MRVITATSYVINVRDFTNQQLDDLDKIIKAELREERAHGTQVSDKRLYFSSEYGGKV